eukprot:Phypoly_transcript_05238.p1 GENE.Phypoly_transcript_05238~~Phypoly_transcript_05238.p1  ORF type:complete len:575 (+),score=51.88 Phypoly_transcript_05238:253-1977(+)
MSRFGQNFQLKKLLEVYKSTQDLHYLQLLSEKARHIAIMQKVKQEVEFFQNVPFHIGKTVVLGGELEDGDSTELSKRVCGSMLLYSTTSLSFVCLYIDINAGYAHMNKFTGHLKFGARIIDTDKGESEASVPAQIVAKKFERVTSKYEDRGFWEPHAKKQIEAYTARLKVLYFNFDHMWALEPQTEVIAQIRSVIDFGDLSDSDFVGIVLTTFYKYTHKSIEVISEDKFSLLDQLVRHPETPLPANKGKKSQNMNSDRYSHKKARCGSREAQGTSPMTKKHLWINFVQIQSLALLEVKRKELLKKTYQLVLPDSIHNLLEHTTYTRWLEKYGRYEGERMWDMEDPVNFRDSSINFFGGHKMATIEGTCLLTRSKDEIHTIKFVIIATQSYRHSIYIAFDGTAVINTNNGDVKFGSKCKDIVRFWTPRISSTDLLIYLLMCANILEYTSLIPRKDYSTIVEKPIPSDFWWWFKKNPLTKGIPVPTCLPVEKWFNAKKHDLQKLFASYNWDYYFSYTVCCQSYEWDYLLGMVLHREEGPENKTVQISGFDELLCHIECRNSPITCRKGGNEQVFIF